MDEFINHYYSYLLRIWPVKLNDHTVLRASLENPHTGEKWGFANITELCDFLMKHASNLLDSKLGTGGEE